MDNTGLFMQIFQCFGNLDDDVPRKILTEVCEANNLMEQFATRAQLEDDVIVLSGLGEVDEFYDVGVIQLAHDLHLLEDVGSLRPVVST